MRGPESLEWEKSSAYPFAMAYLMAYLPTYLRMEATLARPTLASSLYIVKAYYVDPCIVSEYLTTN